MKKLVFGFIAAIILGSVALWQFQTDAQAAANVTFTDLNGQQINMQDLRGKVVLVKFWATSCTTCVAQMPDTIQHYQDLKSQGFDTIAVAMSYDPIDYVKNFTTSRNLPFPVVLDKDGSLAQQFGDVKLTPTAFLIDKQGNIIKRYLGNYDKQAFLATVEKALAS